MTATESLILCAIFFSFGTFLVGVMVGRSGVQDLRDEAERQIAASESQKALADQICATAVAYKQEADRLVNDIRRGRVTT